MNDYYDGSAMRDVLAGYVESGGGILFTEAIMKSMVAYFKIVLVTQKIAVAMVFPKTVMV